MKRSPVLIAILVLIISSLACQALSGGRSESPIDPIPSFGGGEDSQPAPSGDSEFPMPSDAKNVMSVAGTLNYQTSLGLNDVMAFYRDVYGKQGYAERSILTVTTDTTFNLVFDGHENGQAIVIQAVDLGDGTVNVNIRFEDI